MNELLEIDGKPCIRMTLPIIPTAGERYYNANSLDLTVILNQVEKIASVTGDLHVIELNATHDQQKDPSRVRVPVEEALKIRVTLTRENTNAKTLAQLAKEFEGVYRPMAEEAWASKRRLGNGSMMSEYF